MTVCCHLLLENCIYKMFTRRREQVSNSRGFHQIWLTTSQREISDKNKAKYFFPGGFIFFGCCEFMQGTTSHYFGQVEMSEPRFAHSRTFVFKHTFSMWAFHGAAGGAAGGGSHRPPLGKTWHSAPEGECCNSGQQGAQLPRCSSWWPWVVTHIFQRQAGTVSLPIFALSLNHDQGANPEIYVLPTGPKLTPVNSSPTHPY